MEKCKGLPRRAAPLGHAGEAFRPDPGGSGSPVGRSGGPRVNLCPGGSRTLGVDSPRAPSEEVSEGLSSQSCGQGRADS